MLGLIPRVLKSALLQLARWEGVALLGGHCALSWGKSWYP